MRQPRVLIIGGGAAGLSAAITSARLDVDVTLLEAGARVGRKILASGNGRCNLTNVSASPSAYNHPDFVEPVLRAYPCDAVRSFFGEMGLLTCPDDEGRVYPVTNVAGRTRSEPSTPSGASRRSSPRRIRRSRPSGPN